MKNLFIISCTGKNNLIGVKINNKFFKQNLQKKLTQTTFLLVILSISTVNMG